MPLTREQLVEMCAELAHEANRIYSFSLGDTSLAPWNAAPEILKQSVRQGVRNILDGKIAGPQQSHEAWVAYKTEEGWSLGPEKNIENKTHPLLLPWAELTRVHRVKDEIFFTLVTEFSYRLHKAHCPYEAT